MCLSNIKKTGLDGIMKQVSIAFLCFSESLASVAKVYDFKKYLNNKTCLAKPNVVDFSSNGLHYYPFRVSLESCNRSCNTLDDLSSRMCAPNKIEVQI